jgi:hypothetical protein
MTRRTGPTSELARPAAAYGWPSPQTACGANRLARCAPTTPPSAGLACSTKSHPDSPTGSPCPTKKTRSGEPCGSRNRSSDPSVEEEDQVCQLSGLPPACARLGRATADEIRPDLLRQPGSRGWAAPSGAAGACWGKRPSFRPMALRPRLSVPARRWRLVRLRRAGRAVRGKAHLAPGLPLSGHRLVLKRTATWGAHIGSPGRLHGGCSTVRGGF